MFGFGVAGNFAGHLEQAGEAADFTAVDAAASMPKGIFPWYVPGAAGRLGRFPLSDHTLAFPPAPVDGTALRIQVEPEVGVLMDVRRDDAGDVTGLAPRWVAAFDDCSLRRPGAAKISHKKNWGTASKGLAPTAFTVSDLEPDGDAASLRLACFLRRGDTTHPYGVDSAVPSYTLIGERLTAWLIDRLEQQRGSDDTPLEDVGAMLRGCPDASQVLVGIGASRYEPFGETTFVQPDDEAIVVVYDDTLHSADEVAEAVGGGEGDLPGASVLRRLARET